MGVRTRDHRICTYDSVQTQRVAHASKLNAKTGRMQEALCSFMCVSKRL